MNSTSRIYYHRPAQAWTEALPLGNGRLGAMAWFGTINDRIDLNEDTLWSGYPTRAEAVDPVGALARARAALSSDDYAAAQAGIENDFTSHHSQAYMPLGAMEIHFAHTGETKDYERSLNLRTGVAECHYRVNGGWFCRQLFVSHPAQGLFYRLSAPEGALSCTVTLSSLLRATLRAEDGALIMEGRAPWHNRARFPGDPQETCYFEEPERRGMGFLARCEVAVKGGKVSLLDGVFHIEGAQEAVIRLFARTSYAGPFRHPFTQGADYEGACRCEASKARQTPYEALLAAHEADFSALMDRVRFALAKKDDDRPTDERLMAFQESGDDPALYELIFNFGRYLMISASRPGTMAMNLQGIWNDQLSPPWNANYTININTQMNYWPAETCALSEMAEPLFRLMENLRESGAQTARDFYGARGSVTHHNTDAWAMSNPVGNRLEGCGVWAYWQMSFGWLCRHLYEHYLFTLDKDFLAEKAFPCLKAAARFYLDQLTEVEGELAISPATSPENSFLIGGERRSVARAAAMSDAIVREVMDEVRAACAELNRDDEILGEIDAVYPRLRKPHIGADGRLMEWDREYEETDPHHRHTSHLYALHPGHMISPDRTPELAAACRETLNARGDGGTGWSLGWKINFWARLNDGDRALKLLKNQLRFVPSQTEERYHQGGTYLNLFDAHPPFQIDGNFGATAGVQEMLMRSEADRLTLLPALPSQWRTGEITGLRAMYCMGVSVWFADGRLKRAVIEAEKDPPRPVSVVVAGQTRRIIDRAGRYEIEGEGPACF